MGTPPIRAYGLDRTVEHPQNPLSAKGQLPTGVIRACQVKYPETSNHAAENTETASASPLFSLPSRFEAIEVCSENVIGHFALVGLKDLTILAYDEKCRRAGHTEIVEDCA